MGSSYPAQEGGRERGEGYTVEVYDTEKVYVTVEVYVIEKGYIGTFMVNVVREMVEFIYGECSQRDGRISRVDGVPIR
jgi:hypothetical protein